MSNSNNPRRYTAPERLFHRVNGVVGNPLQRINEQHRNDAQRTGGIPVEVPDGSYDLGTRKIRAVLNEYSPSSQRDIREFLTRVLNDSLDTADRDD